MTSRRIFLACTLAVALLVTATLAGAQDVAGAAQARMGQQSLRPYWHVFAAYAVVIVLVGGWMFSIARRLRELEGRLTRDS